MTEKKQRILAGAVAGSYSDGLLTGAPHKSQTARRRNRTEMHTWWLCCRRWLCAHCLCKCTASERQVSAHFSLKTYVCLPRVAAVWGRAATLRRFDDDQQTGLEMRPWRCGGFVFLYNNEAWQPSHMPTFGHGHSQFIHAHAGRWSLKKTLQDKLTRLNANARCKRGVHVSIPVIEVEIPQILCNSCPCPCQCCRIFRFISLQNTEGCGARRRTPATRRWGKCEESPRESAVGPKHRAHCGLPAATREQLQTGFVLDRSGWERDHPAQ